MTTKHLIDFSDCSRAPIPRRIDSYNARAQLRSQCPDGLNRGTISMAKPWILGLCSGFHNGAACLLHGDEIVVAIQEERLTRIKRAALRLEKKAACIDYCLTSAALKPDKLDAIVNCTITFDSHDKGESDLQLSPIVLAAGPHVEIFSIPHHLGHAVSAYATSGFENSASLVIDGGGSFGWQLPYSEARAALSFGQSMCEHISVYLCSQDNIVPIEKHLSLMPYLFSASPGMMPFASLGHMFSSVALQIFGNYFEAGKVMGLAPYGQPVFSVSEFFQLHEKEFRFSDAITRRFTENKRWPNDENEYKNLAASVQNALEIALREIISRLELMQLSDNLCYSGGVALNSVANRTVFKRSSFSGLHVIPAAEDSGTAIGAAYYGLMKLTGRISLRRLVSDFLGRNYSSDNIDSAIEHMPGIALADPEVSAKRVAELLCAGNIVGWFAGQSEFGPRALGHRSILCDPRATDGKQRLNEKVKHRERFRPFAPIILEEHVSDWFSTGRGSELMEFMLEVCPLRDELPGPAVPVVTHVDGTGRVQVVSRHGNPDLYDTILQFYLVTGVPMLVNTSMNIMGEPMVETPIEALWLLLSTGLDYCIIDRRLVAKEPAFVSVLDLIPYVTCEVQESGERLTLSSKTQHGTVEYHGLGPRVSRFLSHVDGVLTGREILHKIDDLGFEEQEGCRFLGELFRLSAVRFLKSTRSH